MNWISVKDRLPSKDHDEIVCLINGNPVLAIVTEANFLITDNLVWFSIHDRKWIKDGLYGKVTHWMPLPQKPKE